MCVCSVLYACWFLVVVLIFEKLVLLLHNTKIKTKTGALPIQLSNLKNHTISLTSALVSHFHVDVCFKFFLFEQVLAKHHFTANNSLYSHLVLFRESLELTMI